MSISESLWRWLIHAAVLSGLVLIVGTLALLFVRQAADRLRLIQWVLAGCLVAPWLPALSGWKTVSLNLMATCGASLNGDVSVAAMLPSEPAELLIRNPAGEIDVELDPASHEPGESIAASPEHPPKEGTRTSLGTPPNTIPPRRTLVTSSIASQRFSNWANIAYLTIVTLMGLWWLSGLARRSALQRSAEVASAELQALFDHIAGPMGRRARLLVSDRLTGPITWGLFHPVIMVPTRFVEAPHDRQLCWSLAHEWSHVERRDARVLLLARLVQLVCFYQPLYWWLSRQMTLCQDFIADARAAEQADSPEDYADFLIHLAHERLRPRFSGALGIIDGRSSLFHRVQMLISSDAPIQRQCSRLTGALISTSAVAVLALLSTIRLDAAPEPAPPSSAATNDAAAGEQPKATDSVAAKPDENLPEAGVIAGVLVRASDGSPVPDATVIVHTGGSNKTRSDAQGRFRLEGIRGRSRPYDLWAHAGNLITQKTPVRQLTPSDAANAKFAPLRLEMTDGKQAKFIVRSEITGKPVEGAVVRFGYPDRRKQSTDAEGTTVVPGLLAEDYDVIIEADGHARDAPQINLARAEAVAEYKIALVAGGVARGSVSDAAGKPVHEAEVVYFVANGTGFHGDDFRTDAEGRFQHRFLPLNVPIEISVQHANYVAPQTKTTVVLTADRRESDVRITMQQRPKGRSVAGVVQDQNGKPVAGVKIASYGRQSSPHKSTITDAQGNFLLEDLVEGSVGCEIAVSAKGFAPQLVTIPAGKNEKPAPLTVTLEPGHTLRGIVVDEDGKPMPEAQVSVRSSEYQLELGETIQAGAGGEFAFDSLPANARFDVWRKSYARRSNIPLVLDGEDRVKIVLESPAIIRGHVIDAETMRPIPQFVVRLGFCRSRQPGDAQGTFNGKWSQPGVTFKSDKGEFVVDSLTNRMPLELTVEADGYARAVVPRAVAAKPDQATPVEISLKRVDVTKVFTLTGQFLNHEGKSVPGAQLRLIVSADQPTGSNDNRFNWVLIKSGQLAQKSYCEQFLSGVTDAEGRFKFDSILPDRFLQLVYWGPHVPQGRSLAFDETKAQAIEDVTIRLPQPAAVIGTIDRSKFPDAGSARLILQSQSFQDYEIQLRDDQKTFAFDNLPPGDYSVGIYAKPVRFTENGATFFRVSPLAGQKLRLAPGKVEEVRFTEPDKQP